MDLSLLPLDMAAVPAFHRRVYDVARTIPPGATLSYGEIADRLGSRGLSRAVGQALGRNPFLIVVPCHRVLAAGGRLGGFSASGGITTKLRLLAIEGRHGAATPSLFDGDGAFDFDQAEAVAHVRSDPAMARLIDAVGPFAMELKTTPSLFVALAESIVYQQLTGKAAATIFARVPRALPTRPSWADARADPARQRRAAARRRPLEREAARAARPGAAKRERHRADARRGAQQMDDETLIARLTEVRGIGRWTVEMLLMFRLGRPDVLPVDDYGVRQGFAIAYRKRKLPPPKALAKYGARWAPYRTVASWYLWRAVDLSKRGA